jgi:hypothetical protein
MPILLLRSKRPWQKNAIFYSGYGIKTSTQSAG